MEQTECSETSAYKIHTPGNYPKENIQHTEDGESLKSRIRGSWLDSICASQAILLVFKFSQQITQKN